MSKRTFVLILLAVAATLALSACGGGAAAPTSAPGAAKLKVGLVTDVGHIDDKSFNQSAWEGIQCAQKALGLDAKDLKYIETTDSKDYDKNLAQFADANYDVIVTSGFNMGEPTYLAAKKYPKVKFIGTDQFLVKDDKHPDFPEPNFAGIVFAEDQPGYLAGVLAASVSKTGKIGAVAGTDAIPPVWRYVEGYRAGAKSVNPNVEVFAVYHNDVGFDKTFLDPEWGKTTALSMIDKGADVIFGVGGKTGNGALSAAAEKGKYAIGVDSDQYLTVPEAQKALVSSAMKLIVPSVCDNIKAVAAGTFKGGNVPGAIGLAPFHDLDSQVPAAVKTKLEEVKKGLDDGSIKTNVPPVKPS